MTTITMGLFDGFSEARCVIKASERAHPIQEVAMRRQMLVTLVMVLALVHVARVPAGQALGKRKREAHGGRGGARSGRHHGQWHRGGDPQARHQRRM